MRVLCLGYSSLVQRRVLPALGAIDQVQAVELASRRALEGVEAPKLVQVHRGFEAALAESRAQLVYVSTVNSQHVPWALAALERGFHVVVDKPAATRLADVERLLAAARARERVLAESLVYGAHPQLARVRELFRAADSAPRWVAAQFIIPPLPADNFRYRRELGGGALLDLGPYAVSLGRLLFDAAPAQVHATVEARGPAGETGAQGVETAFSALFAYPGGRSVVGQFGFAGEYTNALRAVGPGCAVALERVFTTPASLENPLQVRVTNQTRVESAPAACPFACFLRGVLEAIAAGDGEAHAAALEADARALAALRVAAGWEDA